MSAQTDEPASGLDRLASQYAIPEEDTPEREGYRIESDRHAAWAFDLLRADQAEADRIGASADEREALLVADPIYAEIVEQLTAVENWRGDRLAGIERHREWVRGVLVDYIERQLEENPKLPKTYELPNGTIARRKLPDRIEVLDQLEMEPISIETPVGAYYAPEFVAWALDAKRYDLLRVEPDKRALLAAEQAGNLNTPGLTVDSKGKPSVFGERSALITADGEIVPGVEYVVGIERIGNPETR